MKYHRPAQDIDALEAGLAPAMEAVRRNPASIAEGGPASQPDKPPQSRVWTWAEDDAAESKE